MKAQGKLFFKLKRFSRRNKSDARSSQTSIYMSVPNNSAAALNNGGEKLDLIMKWVAFRTLLEAATAGLLLLSDETLEITWASENGLGFDPL